MASKAQNRCGFWGSILCLYSGYYDELVDKHRFITRMWRVRESVKLWEQEIALKIDL